MSRQERGIIPWNVVAIGLILCLLSAWLHGECVAEKPQKAECTDPSGETFDA